MKLENQNILIVSNEPWGDIWYSKHNYANELAKRNKVFFLNPPKPFSFSNIFNFRIVENRISESLTVLQYPNFFPVSLPVLWKLNDKIVLRGIRNFFQSKNIKDIIFWTFDPIRLGFPEILRPGKIILHIVDDYKFTFNTEKLLATKADFIICVSDKIASNYKNLNQKIRVIPHVIPDNEFTPLPARKSKTLTGIFIGKMDERIDFRFNLGVFKAFPSVTFKLIGITSPEFSKLVQQERLKNIEIVPPIKSSDIKNHVAQADFCFIFKKIYIGNNFSSHKLLQYLAQGKPIFGTDFTDMSSELKATLYLSNDLNTIIQVLSRFLENGEPPNYPEIRINYAKERTFSSALKQIEELLNT